MKRSFAETTRSKRMAVHFTSSTTTRLLLLLCTLSAAVRAQDFDYRIDAGAVTITRYRGSGGAVNIPGTINGLPGFVTREADGMLQTTALLIEDGLIRAIYVMRNPEKLRHLTDSIH